MEAESREAEKPARVSNDAEVLIKPDKEDDESAEKKKAANGFLVSRAGS